MAIQSALAQVGVAKQSAKGVAAANPTFAMGITDGAIVTVDVAQEMEEHTSSSRFSVGVNRTGVTPGLDYTTRVHPRSVGLLLFGALGAVSTTGTNPYTHTITTGDDLPYLTAFGKMGSNIYAVNDCKIDSLEISFDETNPVEIAVAGMGTTANYAATFTPTTDDTVQGYFAASRGTFQLDVDSSTPVTASIKSGSISISNNMETIMLSGSISPNDVFPGRQDIEVSFDVVPDNFADWRTIVTGTSSGTTASVDPIYGSFSIQFTDGTNTLTLAATRVAFTVDFPAADPAGGSLTMTLAGIVVKPSAGNALTATLVNTQVSY